MPSRFLPIASCLVAIATPVDAQQQVRPRSATVAEQITEALLPLPDSLRAGAGVIGFDQGGNRTTLKPSTNDLICQRVWPGEEAFDVRCYHREFLPVVERRLALAAQGVKGSAYWEMVERELKAGKLTMAMFPTAGYRMLGSAESYDSTGHTWTAAMERWQSVHVPYLTAAKMGFSTDEQRDMPYVMASGTYWAHVMFLHGSRSAGANEERR